MTEHNGIDILCDAAGSDLLLSSLLSHVGNSASASGPASTTTATTTHAQGQQQQQQQQSQLVKPESHQANGHPPLQEKAQDDQDDLDPHQKNAKRVKVAGDTPSSAANPSHVCNICKRVYERADHLTRHLRSHENARQYKCGRCPKRFNRADLLTRHESTHDREGEAGRPLIRRSDRAAEACLNCAASKAKCDDRKPCGRCRAKSLVCQTPSRRMSQYKTASDDYSDFAISPSESSTMGGQGQYKTGAATGHGGPGGHPASDASPIMNAAPNEGIPVPVPAAVPPGVPHDMPRPDMMIMDGIPDEMVYFDPVHSSFQDMDFTFWDLNFDAFSIPQLDTATYTGPSPPSTVATSSTSRPHSVRDPSRGHSAFKRSPWLWEPDTKDFGGRDAERLALDENTIAHSPAFDKLMVEEKPARRMRMSLRTRDRLFAVVLALNKDPKNPMRVPSFPSLELLNYLLQAHFVQDEYNRDSYIHAASFDPDETLSELLAIIIANGAMFIAVNSIWQFGFALQECVRQRMDTIFESSNTNTRNLKCWQTFMVHLDISLFSGFKRQTELAEGFLQPLLTMVRRSGVLSAPADSLALIPLESDPSEVLDAKWQKWIVRESCKRLVIHLFIHDVHAAVALQKRPLLSVVELSFSLPAAKDLWRAPSAEAWRSLYLAKRPLAANSTSPRISEVMHSFGLLDMYHEHIDLDLAYSVVLYGFWSQIDAYRGSIRFYNESALGKMNSTHQRLWLRTQHQELYRELLEFSTLLHASSLHHSNSNSNRASAGLSVAAELFLMTLHVSIDDLQKFAGKSGEDESRRIAAALEDGWARTPEARYAVWHAGQVLRHARRMAPTTLRGFSAMAAYFASLTLWVYGLLACAGSDRPQGSGTSAVNGAGGDGYLQIPRTDASTGLHHHGGRGLAGNRGNGTGTGMTNANIHNHISSNLSDHNPAPSDRAMSLPLVVLDGEEGHEPRAFLQMDHGIPALSLTGANTGGGGGVESLSNPGMVLTIARNLFRDNFPVRSEPLPPLVESLVNLLRDLGSGQAGRPSRAVSET